MDKDKKEQITRLMEAIIMLKTKDECRKFFFDLCTADELSKIERRFQIAKLIVEGYTYRQILEEKKASNIIVSRLKGVMDKEDSTLLKIIERIGNNGQTFS